MSDEEQLFLETLGGNRLGRSKFLGEERDFEFFDHPAEFLHCLSRCAGTRRRGLQLLPRILIRRDLAGALLIREGILRGALDAGQQRLEVATEVGQAVEGNLFEKARRQQRGQFGSERMPAGRGSGRSKLAELIERPRPWCRRWSKCKPRRRVPARRDRRWRNFAG